MTLARLVAQLQQLLLEHPHAATAQVVVVPHGTDAQQALAEVHLDWRTVQLEARD
jgi:hypothetical protein